MTQIKNKNLSRGRWLQKHQAKNEYNKHQSGRLQRRGENISELYLERLSMSLSNIETQENIYELTTIWTQGNSSVEN